MKILHLTYSDNFGGANLAASRLNDLLNKYKIKSNLLVIDKKTNSKNVNQYHYFFNFLTKRLRPYLEKILLLTLGLKKHKASLNIIPSNLSEKINKSDYDIVHLHWVNNEMISLTDIANIKKPIFWTLHDLWPASSILHYPEKINTNQLVKFILNKYKIRKRRLFKKFLFYIICPSNWIKEKITKGSFINPKKIFVIPNPIKINFWKFNREITSKNNKIQILIGAVDIINDNRKGFKNFIKILSRINHDILPEIEFIVFGSNNYKMTDNNFNFQIKFVNYLNKNKLRDLYCTANAFIICSEQDNLPNTAIESMLCGTPVIYSGNNGLRDIIVHKKNGYFIRDFNKNFDLINAFKWSLKSKRVTVRAVTKNNFGEKILIQKFFKAYNFAKNNEV